MTENGERGRVIKENVKKKKRKRRKEKVVKGD